ncbi:hypothetical protein EYF80_002933 [Liparis tanakae]|uniref:Uncharacterized protein n=1 Tax=Liparis tanakae TaxID=230148 RepID=A0A4Z2J9G0_9TELE|nr:hypothetical protein EYF80_002933 [Liparis tanakae]
MGSNRRQELKRCTEELFWRRIEIAAAAHGAVPPSSFERHKVPACTHSHAGATAVIMCMRGRLEMQVALSEQGACCEQRPAALTCSATRALLRPAKLHRNQLGAVLTGVVTAVGIGTAGGRKARPVLLATRPGAPVSQATQAPSLLVESFGGFLVLRTGEGCPGIQQASEWPNSLHSVVQFPVIATSGRERISVGERERADGLVREGLQS